MVTIGNPLSPLVHLARLYGDGGLIVDDRPHLWTMVQPDGDVVARVAKVFFSLDPARQEAVLRRHLSRIRAIERAAEGLSRTLGTLRRYAWLPPAATLVAGMPMLSIEWLAGALIASGGLGILLRYARALAVRGGLRLIRWRLSRRLRSQYRS